MKGVMRLRSSVYGGCWVPVFEVSKGCSENQTCWPIGISSSEIYCIISAASASGPQVVTGAFSTYLHTVQKHECDLM